MTKEEIMALLRDPDQTGQAVDELNRLIEENPYFHTGHQLYLKGLQQTNEKKMALQLGKTALSVRDRGVLYNYLNRPSSFRQQPVDKPADASVPFIPGNSYVTPETDIHNIPRNQSVGSSSPGGHSFTMGGGWHHTEEEIIAEEKIMSNDQLMEVIRRRLEQITPQAEENSPAPGDTAANAVASTGDVAGTAVEPVAVTSVAVVTGLDVPENTDVLIRGEYTEEQLVADLIKISPINTGIAGTSTYDLVVPEEMPGDVVPSEELTTGDLIDSFLKSNPKIIPGESKYEVDLSESLQEDPDIATETLADIYATQGHKNKAIEIYEHLILKYPEKHIYFAAQINRLKEK